MISNNGPTAAVIALVMIVALSALSSALSADGAAPPSGRPAEKRALLVGAGSPGVDPAFEAATADALKSRGFDVTVTNGDDLSERLSAAPRNIDVLVLPNARFFPADARQALLGFLDAGGAVVFVGGPPLADIAIRRDGKWMTEADINRARAELPPGRVILDISTAARWQRNSDGDTRKGPVSIVKGPKGVGPAVHMTTELLAGWDVLMPDPIAAPFKDGASLTRFWAKGDAQTPEMAVEWREKDGTRRFATVPLTTEWRRYALPPRDFKLQQPSPTAPLLNPEQADRICFGVTRGKLITRPGRHSFWIAGVSTSADPFGDVEFSVPVIECNTPSYKTFDMGAASLTPISDHVERIFDGQLHGETKAVCQVWRSRGLGSSTDRSYRWIPLLKADSKNGGWGVAGAMTVFEKGAVAYFGIDDPAFVEANRETLASAVANAADRLASAPFLYCAGTSAFAAWEDGPSLTFGATVNRCVGAEKPEVEFAVTNGTGRQVALERRRVEVTEAGRGSVSAECGALSPGVYTMESRLVLGGRVIDRISHEFRVIKSKRLSARDVVTSGNGEFRSDGKVWRGVGVNYWPLSTVGEETADFYNRTWLHPAHYDPTVAERDLRLLAAAGMNLVSIWYTRPESAPCIADFLERCHAHGIKANVFIEGANPTRFREPDYAIELIRAAHLQESPAIFAYDLGWEIQAGNEGERNQWNAEWKKWAIEQYGSIENAERDWGYQPQRSGESISGPADNQLTTDGPWRRMVAAYRRFWDDFICRRYGHLTRGIRSVDRVHMLGVRCGWGGSGSMWAVPGFPIDLAGPAIHFDFTSPEYPDLLGERGWLESGLTTAYGRFVSGGKPVYWAEYGYNAWPPGKPEELQRQADYLRRAYRMFAKSGVGAGAAWWFRGGARLDEGSDMGLVNQDYTLRPALKLPLAEFLGRPPLGTPNHLIDIDRDLYVTGYAGVYAAHRGGYARETEAGKTVALKTAGTGTNSANTPLVAVGNVPCNGSNPPNYLNVDFGPIEVKRADGRWEKVTGPVAAAERIEFRVRAGNTGEAAWLSPAANAGKGSVYLVARCAGRGWRLPLPHNVPFLSSVEIGGVIDAIPPAAASIELRMWAEERVEFGPRITLQLAR